MSYTTYHVIICDECKIRSDIIEIEKHCRIVDINIFNIISFIEKHVVCGNRNKPLIIKEIADDDIGYYSQYYQEGAPIYIPGYKPKPIAEDLDINTSSNYENYMDMFIESLKEHKERYKKIQELKPKLGICLDKPVSPEDLVKLYKEAFNSEDISINGKELDDDYFLNK